jgi:hypothetical protein
MASKFPNQQIVPSIINQPKADIILKSYGLNALKKELYKKATPEEEDQEDARSKFGLPVFDNIILLAPNYDIKVPKEDIEFIDDFGKTDEEFKNLLSTRKILEGNIRIDNEKTNQPRNELIEETGNGFPNALQINTVLIELTQTKNVVVTPIAGASGTIKEYIGDGDYQIKIRGFLEGDAPNKYPTVDVRNLSEYLQAPVPIKIISNYLRTFDISSIVVTDYAFPQQEGRRNLQFFELTAVSDKELEAGFIKEEA